MNKIINRLIAAFSVLGALGLGTSKPTNAITIATGGIAVSGAITLKNYLQRINSVKSLANLVEKGSARQLRKKIIDNPFLYGVVKEIHKADETNESIASMMKNEVLSVPGKIKSGAKKVINSNIKSLAKNGASYLWSTIKKDDSEYKTNDSEKSVTQLVESINKMDQAEKADLAKKLRERGETMAKEVAISTGMTIAEIWLLVEIISKTTDVIIG